MAITFWFTGLPGSGKTTLARALAQSLTAIDYPCRVIDGDELRQTLCIDLGYSREDRRQNVLRAADQCKTLNDDGIIAIAALISPYRADRQTARERIGSKCFREIWVSAPMEVCAARDPKGLYRLAQQGEIQDFTGVSGPYEPPTSPTLTLETHRLQIDECISKVMAITALPMRIGD